MEPYKFTIPAYGKIDVNTSGNRIYCETATAPFNLKSGNQTFLMKEKRTYVLKSGLNKFLLENTSAAPITVELYIGNDEIIDNTINLAGTVNINGNVPVVNAAGQKLAVDDAVSQAALAAIQTAVAQVKTAADQIKAAIQGDKTARQGLTDLRGTSRGSAINSAGSVLLVSAATNTNGVLIKYAYAYDAAGLVVDGVTILYGGSVKSVWLRDLIVPAGQAIHMTAGNGGAGVNVFYEVL